MAEFFRKKYRLANPYKPDETITQEVVVGDEPTYTYADSPWVAIDTEFFNLSIPHSQLCVIQIASPDPDDDTRQRVEVLWVWQRIAENTHQATQKLIKEILADKKKEIIMHVSTADLPRLENFAHTQLHGKLFDTKVAAKIALTNTRSHGMDDIITLLIDPKFQKDKFVTASQWDLHPEMWADRTLEYTMNDVIYLHPLREQLLAIAKRRNLGELVEQTMKAMPAVCALYRAGYDVSTLSY